MSCNGVWENRAEVHDWKIFIKAICNATKECPKFPTDCKKCLDLAGITNTNKLPC